MNCPTKEQIIKAADSSPEAYRMIKIMFPELFKLKENQDEKEILK